VLSAWKSGAVSLIESAIGLLPLADAEASS
jgi:hypothetical protein